MALNYTDFAKSIPHRRKFAINDPELRTAINTGKPIYFLPNSILEKQNRQEFNLILFGIIENGEKVTVFLNNINLYFDIRIPDPENNTDTLDFKIKIENILNDMNIDIADDEIVYQFPFMGYQEEKVPYLRLKFNKKSTRKLSIEHFRKNEFTYNGNTALLELAADDTANHHNKIAREYKFNICGWNTISKYTVKLKHDDISSKISKIFELSIDDLKPVVDVPKKLLKDKSIIMSWDLETYEPENTGSAPMPDDAKSVIYMASCAFYWIHESVPFYSVCLTTLLCPEDKSKYHDDSVIVQCNTENDIVMGIGRLLSAIAPEFITGFNDGGYDWPFVISKLNTSEKVNKFAELVSSLRANPQNMQYYNIGIKYEINIKIDAETSVQTKYFTAPGYICIDVMICMRRLYPKSPDNKLNTFLNMNKLGSKEDISIATMAKIYNLCAGARKKDIKTYEDLEKFLIDKEDSQTPLHEDFGEAGNYLKRITAQNALQDLMTNIPLVIKYCNVDAQKCQELLLKKMVIMDYREMGNLSYTSMLEAVYRANGAKVRNLLIAECIKTDRNLAISNYKEYSSVVYPKFPGGYVLPPKRGLYRDQMILENKPQPEGEQRINARPLTGLDFSSLYPSLIMAYNFSPEKLIKDKAVVDQFNGKLTPWGVPYQFTEVDFDYGTTNVHGWFVRHSYPEHPSSMGIYATILQQLFDKRVLIKKQMKIYEHSKETLNKAISLHEYGDDIFTNLSKIEEENKAKYEENPSDFLLYVWKQICKDIEFIKKEWPEGLSLNEFINDLDFNYEYLNSKQKALKVFMNTFYGETGSNISPLFVIQVAGGITTYGQKNIKAVKEYAEKKNYNVLYGDSVSADTPILIRYTSGQLEGNIDIKTIDDIPGGKWFEYSGFKVDANTRLEKEQLVPQNLETWTSNGWAKIKRVIRHKTNKKMYRINTHQSCIDVTEDHSLLGLNRERLKPNEVKVGDELFHGFPKEFPSEAKFETEDLKLAGKTITEEESYVFGNTFIDGDNILNPVVTKYKNLFYDKRNYKIVPRYILNSPINIRKAFIDGLLFTANFKNEVIEQKGKISIQCIYYLLKSIGYEKLIIGTDDNTLSISPNSSKKNRNQIKAIKQIIELPNSGDGEFVYDIETEDGTFQGGVGNLVVHNTDSLYVTCPEDYFKEIDNAYLNKDITKKEFWTKMIEISMTNMDVLKNEVNQFLINDNGTKFLKMAYEEVLFPYMLLGKKEYIGIQHQNQVNLRICEPDCTLQEFMKSKSLFIRGPMSKSSLSNFVKQLTYEVIQEVFSLTGDKAMFDIIKEIIKHIESRKWDIKLFAKPGTFRAPKTEGGGAKSFIYFNDRMKQVAIDHPTVGIVPLEYGDKFEYVVAKKTMEPDVRGRKTTKRVGDQIEFVSSFYNEEYKAIYPDGLVIDLYYYMEKELMGLFSHFIAFNRQFQQQLQQIDDDSDEDNNDSFDSAKKYLKKYCKQYMIEEIIDNTTHKKVFNEAKKTFKLKFKQNDSCSKAIIDAGISLYGNKTDDAIIINEIDDNAYKLAKKKFHSPLRAIMRKFKLSPNDLKKRYWRDGKCWLIEHKHRVQQAITLIKSRLYKELPQLKLNIDDVHNSLKLLTNGGESVDIEISAAVKDLYYELAARYYTLETIEDKMKNINVLILQKTTNKPIIRLDLKSDQEQLEEFLKNKY